MSIVGKPASRRVRMFAAYGVAAAAVSAGAWLSRGAIEERGLDTAAAQALVRRNLPKMPLSFEANRGQTDAAARFVARGAAATMWLTDREAVFAFTADAESSADVLRMEFVGAGTPEVSGRDERPAKSNYLRADGADIRGVPHFAEVAYEGLYPGVDMRWYGDRSKLEYDVIVAAGADASVVRMAMKGADELKVTEAGELAVTIGDREIVQRAPYAYQVIDGEKTRVAAAFDVRGNEFGFRLGAYDASRELVIDPSLEWSTYLGGSGAETCNRIAVDAVSSVPGIVVCGATNSIDFPLGYGHIPSAPRGDYDAYVSKLSPQGDFVRFSTYLAGRGYDEAFSVAVAQHTGPAVAIGDIWLTGQTDSANFPTFRARQPVIGGAWDAFVAGIDPTGDHLTYSSFLGGSKNDYGRGVELDVVSPDYVYVTGFTNSLNLPDVNHGPFKGGANDAFLSVYEPVAGVVGLAPIHSWYLGGLADDRGYDVAVGQGGGFNDLYVVGYTASPDFPRLNLLSPIGHTMQDNYGGGLADAFVTRFTGFGSSILWSSTWGGSGDEWANGVAVDSTTGDVAITGRTNSFDFPRVSAFQPVRRGPDDAFVSKFKPDGQFAVFSTYMGGGGSDVGNDLVINRQAGPNPTMPFPGDVYVIGTTESADFPVTGGQLQSGLSNGMNTDAWIARIGTFHNDFGIDQDGLVKFASYFGGNGYDYGNGIALASPTLFNSQVLIAGTTRSTTNFPFAFGPPVVQSERDGESDAFVVKLSEANPPLFPAGDTVAVARTPDSIEVSWRNPVLDATDLVIDRIGADGVATTVATIAPTATQFTDTGLAADTTYNYQITAQIQDGTKVSSDVVAASTLPYPPAPPAGLDVSVAGSRVSLSWTDASSNETGFEVQRMVGVAEFTTVATVKAGATKFETTQILTGAEDAAWRVVAVNRGGSSAPSNEVEATATPTVSLSVQKGTLVDARTSGADKFSASGDLAGAAGFDPNAQSLRIELGSSARPLVLSVPAGDRGWSAKRGVLKFDSARSFVGGARFRLAIDPKKGTFSLTVSGFDFPVAVANPVSLGFALGDKAGAARSSWTAKGAGKYVTK